MKKDILLYMSDQHAYQLQGYAGNPVVRTKMLDWLAAHGTVMTNAMTACPLCVPARAAMISGQLPSNNGVLFNFSAIDSNQATFLHSLHVSGYETVLCGRMHFVGPDQRHGYEKRIAGERTPVFHNGVPQSPEEKEGNRRVRGFDEGSSIYYMGEGDSPVLAYDRYVVEHALQYLEEDHDKPLFLTVGSYGPHFPYVAPKDFYEYYYDRVPADDAEPQENEHPALDGKLTDCDPEVVRAARAAYYGLVEETDHNIEKVYEAFQAYLKRTGHEGIFIYISDHGDMNGEKGYYGKQVFYDPSVHIPFIIQGDGIPEGARIDSPVSLLDLGPTVCELAGAQVLRGDGRSLAKQLASGEQDWERMVVSELYTYLGTGGSSLGRMVRWKQWKFITYSGFEGADQLFDCERDPKEQQNVIDQYPEIAEKLRAKTKEYKDYDKVMEHESWMMDQLRILMQCHYDDAQERWVCPELEPVENVIKSKKPFEKVAWVREMFRQLREKPVS